MRSDWESSAGGGTRTHKTILQGLTRKSGQSISAKSTAIAMASRVKRLKVDNTMSWEVNERRQVGDAESMLNEGLKSAWWRHVGIEEDV